MWKMNGTEIEAIVVRHGRPSKIDELIELSQIDPLDSRLAACLQLVALSGPESERSMIALTEAAMVCHMARAHALNAASVVARKAARLGVTHRQQAAAIVTASAAFQHALASARAKRSRTTNNSPAVDPVAPADPHHQISAQQLIGAWQGLYGDHAGAVALLQDSVVKASDLESRASRTTSAEARYLGFIGSIRLAELHAAEQRQALLAQAAAVPIGATSPAGGQDALTTTCRRRGRLDRLDVSGRFRVECEVRNVSSASGGAEAGEALGLLLDHVDRATRARAPVRRARSRPARRRRPARPRRPPRPSPRPVLRAQPVTPRRSASRRVESRKKTPCT